MSWVSTGRGAVKPIRGCEQERLLQDSSRVVSISEGLWSTFASDDWDASLMAAKELGKSHESYTNRTSCYVTTASVNPDTEKTVTDVTGWKAEHVSVPDWSRADLEFGAE
jgi:hypothetical protein